METRPDILVFSLNYFPEPTGFAPHVTAFCENLAASGKKITVLTGFPFAPRWERWPDYRGSFRAVEQREGVQIVRNTHFIPRAPRRLVERVLMESSFCTSALWAVVRLRLRAKVLIYVGAQPSIAMLCRVLAALTGARYGVMINDLATGAARDVGIVGSAWVTRLLHRFEYSAYRAAAGAVVLCNGFKQALVAEGYAPEKIWIVRSPVDTKLIKPAPAGGANFRLRHGLAPEDFVVLFAGSMGLKQGLENVIEAAGLLSMEDTRIKWVLVGDGERRGIIERKIRSMQLEGCVQLIPFQQEAEMSGMFSSADVLLLNQLSAVKDTVIPSKLLTYMAAGQPVIAAVNADSEGAELLREAGGGYAISPENPAALAAAVRDMKRNPERRIEMGRVNRAYAVDNFDQERIMQQLEEFVRQLSPSTPLV